MSKKTLQNKAVEGSKKARQPKFRLVSYTMKAVIPTGQYANIQPEVTVEAETLEQAERAVMPYIETLFAKYRDGGVKPVEPVRQAAVTPVVQKVPVAVIAPTQAEAPRPTIRPGTHVEPVAPAIAPVTSAIVMTVPFTRAKGALESCTSLEALKLVTDQVEKSTRLVEAEKAELRKLSAAKLATLNVRP